MNPQEKVNKFWRDLVNSPDLVNNERNWSQFIRIKFDALQEVGFTQDQALKIVTESLNVIKIDNNINFFKHDDEGE